MFFAISPNALSFQRACIYSLDFTLVSLASCPPRYRVVLPDHRDDFVFGTGRTDNYSGLVGMVAKQVGGGEGDGVRGGEGGMKKKRSALSKSLILITTKNKMRGK